ncbi:MAG TPA: TetR/AcrR family transcriptional regulator [Syntrophorhabdaceae bacterium]|jgi:AcrR family transcriptional regulator
MKKPRPIHKEKQEIARTNVNSDVRERIVAESIKLFLNKSFRGTSIKDITEAVNLSKGALYWYFETKSKLLETIIEKWEHEFLDPLIQNVSGLDGGFLKKFKAFHKWVSEFPRYHNRELCVTEAALSAEMAGSGTEAEKKINQVRSKYRVFVERLIDEGKKEQLLREELDSRVVAHAIIAFHSGTLLEWYANEDTLDGAVFARTYRDMILQGMLKGAVTDLEVNVIVNKTTTYTLSL